MLQYENKLPNEVLLDSEVMSLEAERYVTTDTLGRMSRAVQVKVSHGKAAEQAYQEVYDTENANGNILQLYRPKASSHPEKFLGLFPAIAEILGLPYERMEMVNLGKLEVQENGRLPGRGAARFFVKPEDVDSNPNLARLRGHDLATICDDKFLIEFGLASGRSPGTEVDVLRTRFEKFGITLPSVPGDKQLPAPINVREKEFRKTKVAVEVVGIERYAKLTQLRELLDTARQAVVSPEEGQAGLSRREQINTLAKELYGVDAARVVQSKAAIINEWQARHEAYYYLLDRYNQLQENPGLGKKGQVNEVRIGTENWVLSGIPPADVKGLGRNAPVTVTCVARSNVSGNFSFGDVFHEAGVEPSKEDRRNPPQITRGRVPWNLPSSVAPGRVPGL